MLKKTLIRGFKITLPLLFTIGIIIWSSMAIESLFRGMIEPWFPFYFPGLGAIIGVSVVFLIGLLINAWVVRKAWNWLESGIERIPLVKTIYSYAQDCMKFFDTKKGGLGTPVMIEFDGMKLLGFITVEKIEDFKKEEIAVYFPMSYGIGGYTVILPRDRVTPMKWTTQDTMKFVLTGGVIGDSEKK